MKKKKEIKKIEKKAKTFDKVETMKDLENFTSKEKKSSIKSNPKFSRIKIYIFLFFFSLIVGSLTYYFTANFSRGVIVFISVFAIFGFYFFMKWKLASAADLRKMEEVFPDFIGLMASNLRAGMTIDKALLLSSRKEFAPLDKEISLLGKDIVTGREITQALQDASKRIGSEKISRTIRLIISGIRSGGNLAVLLEETSENMRERGFVEKRAASNVLMYVIFIFFAVAAGAPLLFGLSTVLVEILSSLISSLPTEQVVTNVPFALTSVSVSTEFIFYFSIIFLITTAFLASMVLGLVSKGKERDGLKYVLPLILIGLSLFFASRFLLLRYFSDLFG